MAGHSVAITQLVGPNQYLLSLLEKKFRIEPASVQVLPLQAIPNLLSAITGNKADFGISSATALVPAIVRGDMKLVGWTSEQVHWQVGVVFTATKTIAENRATVERFLRAYRNGTKAYHDAFSGPDERRQDGLTASKTVAIIAKYVAQTEAQVQLGLPYIDIAARLDARDILQPAISVSVVSAARRVRHEPHMGRIWCNRDPQPLNAEFLATLKDFASMQRSASFTIDQAMEKLKQSLGGLQA